MPCLRPTPHCLSTLRRRRLSMSSNTRHLPRLWIPLIQPITTPSYSGEPNMAVVETLSNPRRADSADEPVVTPVGEARDHFAPVNPLAAWRLVARTHLIAVAGFSVVVNLLMLTLPMYLFQISDRVLTSRSLETLLMLSALALGFYGILSIIVIL